MSTWITGRQFLKKYHPGKDSDYMFELVVNGRAVPWIERDGSIYKIDADSVRRGIHERLMPSSDRVKDVKRIIFLRMRFEYTQKYRETSFDDHYESYMQSCRRNGNIPDSPEIFRKYVTERKEEQKKELIGDEREIRNIEKQLAADRVWKEEFKRMYPHGIPVSQRSYWLERFLDASYDDAGKPKVSTVEAQELQDWAKREYGWNDNRLGEKCPPLVELVKEAQNLRRWFHDPSWFTKHLREIHPNFSRGQRGRKPKPRK